MLSNATEYIVKTPQKVKYRNNPLTPPTSFQGEFSRVNLQQGNPSKIDFRQKFYTSWKRITQLQIESKKAQSQIQKLQKQVKQLRLQITAKDSQLSHLHCLLHFKHTSKIYPNANNISKIIIQSNSETHQREYKQMIQRLIVRLAEQNAKNQIGTLQKGYLIKQIELSKQQISLMKQKIEDHRSIIKKYEGDLKMERQSSEYSFGQKIDRNYEDKNLQIQIQCYKASIQGLLEENKKLKKSFLALYGLKQGQSISQQLQKQIKIMKSILDLNQIQK